MRNSLRLLNLHEKYIDLENHGYVVLDITPARLEGQFWSVDTITAPSTRQRLAAVFETRAGENGLREVDVADAATSALA